MIHPVELDGRGRRAARMRARCRLASVDHGERDGVRLQFGSTHDHGATTTERFAVLADPTDHYMIYDEFRDEPAAIGGHVLIGLSRAWAITLGRRLNDLAAAGAFARRR